MKNNITYIVIHGMPALSIARANNLSIKYTLCNINTKKKNKGKELIKKETIQKKSK